MYEPETRGPFDFSVRRWPAAIRVLGRSQTAHIRRFSETDLLAACRFLMATERRKILKTLTPDDGWPSAAPSLLEWILSVPELRSWWSGSWAWRSPREFESYRKIESHIGAPHAEPYEIANLRLPDDISLDQDVLLFVAWCQGVLHRHLVGDIGKLHRHAICRGLTKFHRSPWIAFTLAAPHMEATGVLFEGAGYFDSCDRLDYLLTHPILATEGEVAAIGRSPMFLAGYSRAKKLRRRGGYMLPATGHWWMNGSVAHALGGNFRRGGVWTGLRGGE